MTVPSDNLRQMELARERYYRRYAGTTSPEKLHWRAVTVRHCLHVLPGETILELGAGSGLWTAHLAQVLRHQNPITAAVFEKQLLTEARKDVPSNVVFEHVQELTKHFPPQSFDYIVGISILSHNEYPQTLAAIEKLLKPGGQMLFFEANFWSPVGFVKNMIPWLGRWRGNAKCQLAFRRMRLLHMTSQQGLAKIEIIPHDIIPAHTPRRFLHSLQSLAFILEHAPLVQKLCGQLYIWAQKPDNMNRGRVWKDLAEHESLFRSTSFVIPCFNEGMNVERLADALVGCYDRYIHEIIFVNDSSLDDTADVVLRLAERDPRVRLVQRTLPRGVGRALRDGYAAATGKYIFSIDSDFVQIVPEFRDLFDAVAKGRHGAIGSRFSYESVLMNYPFPKILCNRMFHLLANLMLPIRVRDVSNNLKLYEAHILKKIELSEDHFAANAETGLRPILAGFDIEEVPISWINRTIDMGTSSFRIIRLAKGYFMALMRIVKMSRSRNREQLDSQPAAEPTGASPPTQV